MEEDQLDGVVPECPCVGSMGLHQNNLLSTHGQLPSVSEFDHNGAKDGFSFSHLRNRSVIDVFRDIRDRYFGKPEIPTRLNRKPSLHRSAESEGNEDGSFEKLESLPIYCKLMILSFLDTQDVCSMSLLNSQWREAANDQILWRELLIRDMCKWDSMTNKSQPLISQVWDDNAFKKSSNGVNFYQLLHGENGIGHQCSIQQDSEGVHGHKSKGINFKALYIHSSFQRRQDDLDMPAQSQTFPYFIKSLWDRLQSPSQGEVIITGPGMDSPRTSKIFRSLMWGNEFLVTKGLLPGNRDFIGSGVEVMFREKIQFNLVALYSGNNRVRETRVGMERLLNSNVVEAVRAENQDAQSIPNEFQLNEAVRFYIAERNSRYKLIYTVDATASQKWEDISCINSELSAILKGTEVDSNIMEALNGQPQEENVNMGQRLNDDVQPAHQQSNSNHVPVKRPLLVLSCVENPSVERISCVQITAMLGLPNINNRQWRVQDVVVSNMQGVEKGLEWLLRQP